MGFILVDLACLLVQVAHGTHDIVDAEYESVLSTELIGSCRHDFILQPLLGET